MAVFQPLYFSAGQYSADTERKLISATVGVDTNSGARLFGVVPEDITNGSMKVSIVSGKLNVAAGMCIVSEDPTENSVSGGYVAGVVSTVESYTPATNSTGSTVTDLLYAVVDPTQYVITAKQQTTTTAVRITTSTNHGFVEGRTVVITGLGSVYDGTYVLGTGSIISTTVFQLTTPTIATTDPSPVTISAAAYFGTTPKIITAKALESGVARLTSASHGLSNGDTVTIVGVDSTFDGTYKIENVQTNTFDYVVNKVVADVASFASPTSVSTSSIARAATPFYIAAERGSGTTLASKSKVLLAQYYVATGGSTPSFLVDKRKYVSSLGGTSLYTTDGGTPSSSAGRFRFNVDTNVLEYYNGTSWIAPIELASSPTDTTSTKASRGDHTHSGFSAVSHTHASYEPMPHGAGIGAAIQHDADEITDFSPTVEPTFFTPVSTGNTSNTYSITGTSSSSSLSPSVEVAVNTTTDCKVMVIFSAVVDSISDPTGGSIFVSFSPRLQSGSGSGGTVLVSEIPSYGTLAHQSNASDGTAWSESSEPNTGRLSDGSYTGSYPVIGGMRIFNLTAGTKYFHLRFRISSSGAGPATAVLSKPTIKVIPLTAL